MVPLNPATRGMVDAGFLAAMKDGATLINVARGPVVDTAALLAELKAGRLMAGLDVTDPEPLPPDHPLWDAPNLILTPHVGGFAVGAFGRIMRIMGEGMEALARGERPANLVPLSELPPPSRRPQH
jgi:phosphoglycerate dehydrogenase-like enzyme